ncbi:MAG TPA: TMEM175 family protein [Acidimicrobiales bacterium]|nr:TMEM175 family protein [Acidimicrobiales bacterium]
MSSGDEVTDRSVLAPFESVGTSRVEAFSDGVMAVIITIMVLGLRAPDGVRFSNLANRFPAFAVYVLSFVFIGIYWNNHHHLFHRTDRISAAVMWANLHLLFWLSLTPLVTEWAGTSYRHRLPAATYGVVAIGCAIAFTILTTTILKANGGKESTIGVALGSNVKGRISPLIYLVGIGLSALSPYAGYGCYALVAVIWFVPDRRLVR